MKKHINKVITHPLVSGSAVVFLGTNVANIFHFLFNFSMVRNLSAASYGDVIGLISLITLATTPAASIIPTIINFAARFYAKNEMSQIRGLFFKLSKILYVFGIALFILFLIFSGWIGNFFHIKNPLLIDITGFIVLVNYASITTNGLLQAKLAFTFISITNLIG
jgi:O-antigen/teichoic acid export membrane protein